MNLLEVKNLNKTYTGKQALTNVSISVKKGSIFGLLGPNGAGKTTFLRILNQILYSDSGEITLNGEALREDHVRKMGYLPEERGLYKKMKVGKQIEYFARLKGISRKEAVIRCNYWLNKLELMDCKNKRTMELSKGMQQKVQFIITVIHEPELIILDEPFSGFDPVNAQLIKEEILDLKRRGTTILLSSHRMENVEAICDHVVMLNLSEKVLDGTIEDIKKDFKGNLYRVKSKKPLEASVNYKVEEEIKENDLFVSRISLTVKPSMALSEIIKTNEVSHFEEVVPSLEEIFFAKVKGGNHV